MIFSFLEVLHNYIPFSHVSSHKKATFLFSYVSYRNLTMCHLTTVTNKGDPFLTLYSHPEKNMVKHGLKEKFGVSYIMEKSSESMTPLCRPVSQP